MPSLPFNVDYYDLRRSFYSGTNMVPDVITVFMKPCRGRLFTWIVLPIENWMDMIPLFGIVSGIHRIIQAVETFFLEAKQIRFQKNDPHLSESWNAFKNLIRGAVAIIPLVGTVSLIGVEIVRAFRIYYSLGKSMDIQQDIIGIAIDGKVIYTTQLEPFRGRNRLSNNFAALEFLKSQLTNDINEAKEQNWQLDMEQLILRLSVRINNYIFPAPQ